MTPTPNVEAAARFLELEAAHAGTSDQLSAAISTILAALEEARSRTPRTDSPGDGVGVGWRFKGSDADLATLLFEGERDLHAVAVGEPDAAYNCALPAYIGEAAERITRKAGEVERMRGALEEAAREIDDPNLLLGTAVSRVREIIRRALDTEGGGE